VAKGLPAKAMDVPSKVKMLAKLTTIQTLFIYFPPFFFQHNLYLAISLFNFFLSFISPPFAIAMQSQLYSKKILPFTIWRDKSQAFRG
jgi:hypothetical protein